MLLDNINTPFFKGEGYLQILFLQRCYVLVESKVGDDKSRTFLIQNTRYCKEVTFEWRKVNVW